MEFVHLHLHTEYSLLDGACRIRDLVPHVGEQGMKAVAITDHGVLYGAVPFYEEANKAGIKPIIGCELYMAPRSRLERNAKDSGERPFHLVLLAETTEGYGNLLKLVSRANTEGFYYKPRVDKELLARYSKGLIAFSSCLAGEIPSLILSGDMARAKESLGQYADIFGKGNYYLELQDHQLQPQKEVNERILEFSRYAGLPLVATNDAHYMKRENASSHDVILCIQTGKTVDDPNRLRFGTSEFYLKTPMEMADLFGHIPESLSNTVAIAERCNVELPLGGHSYLPKYPLPVGETYDSFLRKLCLEALPVRYPEANEAIRERMRYELETIEKMGFSGYFLIVWDFIQYAKKAGIPVGPGRGSVAGSLVAYLLGITEIDPLRYGLIFERFLNPGRKSMPDIDTDFCYERRDEIIRYVNEKYGSDKVAQIITFGTMKARAAVRDAGRALNVSLSLVDKVAKLIEGATLESARDSQELRSLMEQNPQVRKLLDTAQMIEGLPRHASTHAAGVVISPEPLENLVPLHRMGQDEIISGFEMEVLEKVGLLKMDFLGLRNLTVMHDTLKIIKRTRSVELRLEEIPTDDPKTFKLLSQAQTTGVFQLESSGMRNLLRDLKPEKFEDLIPLVALYRPGPLGSGMVDDFVRGRHGRKRVKYPHPSLEAALKETYGVILYQEQVMQIAHIMGGFPLSSADDLRKAMGKKKPEVMAKYRQAFLEGAEAKKIPEKVASKVFDLMEFFSGYGFNKSHSAAYAVVAYQTAYLKANYPVEFMAALLTSVKGNMEKVSIFIQECRTLGILVRRPDINTSYVNFTVGKEGDILFGLGAIKNVGTGAVETIVEARKEGGPFTSIYDLCSRIDLRSVNKKVLESLIKSGACNSLAANRATLLGNLDVAMEAGQRRQKERTSMQGTLFDMGSQELLAQKLYLQEEFGKEQLLAMEKEMLGLYISDHPLSHLQDALESVTSVKILELSDKKAGEEVILAGLVTHVKRITTKNGQLMAAFLLEDLTASVEAIVFPKNYETYSPFLVMDQVVVVRGKTDIKEKFRKKNEEDEDSATHEVKVLVDEIRKFDGAVEGGKTRPEREKSGNGESEESLHIRLDVRRAKSDSLPALKEILSRFRGGHPVFIHLETSKGSTSVALGRDYRVRPTDDLIPEINKIFGEGVACLSKTDHN